MFAEKKEYPNAPKTIILTFARITPIKVLEDSKTRYHAIYDDGDGKYPFKVLRKKNAYTVISCGITCCKSKNVDFIKWNFETQLAKVSPRVFKRSQ